MPRKWINYLTVHSLPHDYDGKFDKVTRDSDYGVVTIDPGFVNLGISKLTINQGNKASIDRCEVHEFKKNRHSHLDIVTYLNTWDFSNVKLVIVEEQIGPQSKVARVSFNIISYFISRCKQAIVVEVKSSLKSKIFSCPGLKGKQLKLWEVQTTWSLLSYYSDIEDKIKMLNTRNLVQGGLVANIEDVDSDTIAGLHAKYKLDDVSTTLVQFFAVLIWLSDCDNIENLSDYISRLYRRPEPIESQKIDFK